jgi:hypothetical protein
MNYGKILSRAWQVIWKNKILWLFGVLASCGNNANSGSSGVDTSGVNFRYDYGTYPDNFPPGFTRFFENMEDFFNQASSEWGMWLGLIILVVFLLSFALFMLRVYGQAGLVRGALKAEQEQPEKLSFAAITEEIKPFYWRLFGFHLLLFVAFFVLIGVFLSIVIAGSVMTLGIGLLCFIPLICLLVPLGWAVSIVIKQAIIALLVDDLSITDALSRGWQVVRSRITDYLVMGLILLVGAWIITIIFSLPQLAALAPVLSAIFQGAWTSDWANFFEGLWFTVACLVAYWPVLLILRGILNSFTETAWVLTYLEASPDRNTPDEEPPLLDSEMETA